MTSKSSRITPELLKDLRTLNVVVFHPSDDDGKELIIQLRRIGCRVQAFWPPPTDLSQDTDVVFLAVGPGMLIPNWEVDVEGRFPTIIAVVTYENPTIVDAVLKVGASSVIASPVKPFGLLSTLVVARQVVSERQIMSKRILRLEAKLSGVRQVSEAKAILMKMRDIDEGAAYQVLRDQAMVKRTTIEQIANAIINANDILS
ncbi:MAG: ANTAR domain-containing protein [Herbaspirillum sp.]